MWYCVICRAFLDRDCNPSLHELEWHPGRTCALRFPPQPDWLRR